MGDVSDTPVIILNWNGWEDTFACLASLRQHCDCHVVWLVDNASADDRRAEASSLYPGLRTFRWDDNYGWAGGYNRALEVALREGYEYVYLLNNDCLATSDFLRAVVDTANANRRAAAVGSYMAYAATPEWVQFDGMPRVEGDRFAAHGLITGKTSRLSGAGMLVRMQAMSECGLFDDRLFCYWEDTEWCARVREAGWNLLIAGGSLLLHRSNGSDENFNALYYLHRNRYLVRTRTELRFSAVRELRYIVGSLRFAGELQRSGRTEEANAIAAGLWDGWTGTEGRRGSPPHGVILFLMVRVWTVPIGFVRRVLELAGDLTGRRR